MLTVIRLILVYSLTILLNNFITKQGKYMYQNTGDQTKNDIGRGIYNYTVSGQTDVANSALRTRSDLSKDQPDEGLHCFQVWLSFSMISVIFGST